MGDFDIFMISGLGADSRAFRNLSINSTKITYIDWIEPLINETIQEYAFRISEPVRKAENPLLIGVSLGGIISMEIKKFLPDTPVILISSMKDKSEKPFLLRFGTVVPLHKFIPPRFMMKSTVIVRSIFGKLDKPDLAVFNDMFMKTSPTFLRWGMSQAINWKGSDKQAKVFHLHGTKDRLFPWRRIKNPTLGLMDKSGGQNLCIPLWA